MLHEQHVGLGEVPGLYARPGEPNVVSLRLEHYMEEGWPGLKPLIFSPFVQQVLKSAPIFKHRWNKNTYSYTLWEGAFY